MKPNEFIKDVAVPVVTLIIGIVTAVTGTLVLSLDRSVKSFDAQLKLREAERLDVVEQRQTLQQQMEVRFRIYEAVTHSLESADARKQRVAAALVLAMLEPDDSLRLGLLEILSSEATPEIKAEATKALTEAIGLPLSSRQCRAGQSGRPTTGAPTISTSSGVRRMRLGQRRRDAPAKGIARCRSDRPHPASVSWRRRSILRRVTDRWFGDSPRGSGGGRGASHQAGRGFDRRFFRCPVRADLVQTRNTRGAVHADARILEPVRVSVTVR